MNKKYIFWILIVLVLCIAGCGKQEEDVQATAETQHLTETTQPVVTTIATMPGLENSEFDNETQPVTEETQGESVNKTTNPVETTKPTEATKPQETTAPTQSAPETKPQSDYENFQNMDAADQQKFMESFENIDAFFVWYNNAKAEHEAANPPIDVGDGTVDMGDLMGGND